MIHTLLAIFIVLHGAVHLIMFGLPLIPKAKGDLASSGLTPGHSWLIGETPMVAFVFSIAVTITFFAAAAGFFWRTAWWPSVMLFAAGGSLVLLMLYASRYWILGYPISIALAFMAWNAIRTA